MLKLKQFSPYLTIILRQVLIWTVAFSFFFFIREFGQEVKDSSIAQLSIFEIILFLLGNGIISGVFFGTYAYYIEKALSRRLSFGRTVLITSLGYLVVVIVLIIFGFTLFAVLFDPSLGLSELRDLFISGGSVVIIAYCFLVGFIVEFVKEVDRKFGPGNLMRMLKGTFFHPKEEERVFMFLDMRSSTTIAEKLGHISYSRLIQDCFKDIGVVADHEASIYQYVGDEAVLTWESEKGIKDSNCLNAYFAFQDKLESRKEYYLSQYGLTPEFKAGVNMGTVTVAEVGDIKRDIAFHGDTINTAARIQSQCNNYGKNLLISASIFRKLSNPNDFVIESVGEVELRGKKSSVEILSVDQEGRDSTL